MSAIHAEQASLKLKLASRVHKMFVTTSQLSKVTKHGRQFKQIAREWKQMEQLRLQGQWGILLQSNVSEGRI